MGSSNKVIRNFIALGSGEAFSRIFAFGATIYLARMLGAEGYGIIAFAMAINLYLVKIAEFSLEWVGTAEVAKSPQAAPDLASTLLTARLALILIVMAISALVAWYIVPEPERSILLLYFLVLIPTALNTKWILIGLDDARPVGISRVLGEALALVIIINLVQGLDELWVAPVAQASGEVCIAFLLFMALRRRSIRFRLRWNLTAVLPVFVKAFPLVSHMLLGLFIYNSDMIFLRLFHNSESVGLYSVAYVLISFLSNLGMTYGMSLMPHFTRLENGSKEEASFYHTILAQIFAVSLPISIGGYLLAAHIIGLAFGEGYTGSVLALQVIIWSIPFNIFRNAPWIALITRNRQDLLFKAMLYAAIANIILNLLLIPKYGVAGAAVATIITEIISSVLMLAFAKGLGLTFVSMRRLVRSIIAGACMAIALVALNPSNIFSGMAFGVVTYILVLSLLGGIQYRKGTLPSLNV